MLIERRRWHQTVFVTAGVYNIAYGFYTMADPQWHFRLAGLAPLNHPEIFAGMGMLLALFGVLYLEVARKPERGWVIAAVGFTSKVLAVLGAAQLVSAGTWGWRAALLAVPNDVIWVVPFALYLWDARPIGRSR